MKRGGRSAELYLLSTFCLLAATLIAWVNRAHDLQSGVYRGQYLPLARYLRGEGPESLITYPLWGYPMMLSVLPNPEVTSLALQIVLATLATLFVYRSVAPYLDRRGPVFILCALAWPLWTLASVKLADSWSASLGVLGTFALAEGLRTRRIVWSVVSGALFGASLNFRSDFLPFLVGLPIGVLLLSPRALRAHPLQITIPIVLAILFVLPWGLYRVHHGRTFGITTTNAGMVLYNSLGFDGNRWGIVSDDGLRSKEVKEALGPDVSPASAEGSRYLREKALEAIMAQPGEFVRKIGMNFRSTLQFGFYGIEVEPLLDESEAIRFEVLKEQLKTLVGSEANPVDIEEFRERGLWDEEFSLASVSLKQWQILALPVLTAGVSAAYLVALLASGGWVLLCNRKALEAPVFLLSTLGVLAFWALLCLLQFEQRQANVLYPLGLPLVALGIDRLVSLRRRPRGKSPPSRGRDGDLD